MECPPRGPAVASRVAPSSARSSSWQSPPGPSHQGRQRLLKLDGVGGPSGTFRQPVQTPVQMSAAPTFSIEGTPAVERIAILRDFNGHNDTVREFGGFRMQASVRVRAAAGSPLKDWDVGIVQMVSGAVDTNCYRRRSRMAILSISMVTRPHIQSL
jgi:hypothetical protein